MNILQSIFHYLQQPPSPPHIGEAFNLWSYFIAVSESRSICMLMLNHTRDEELRGHLEHFITEIEEPQRRRVMQVIRDEGIDFPKVTPEKTKADPQQVPAGAKMTDSEIANMVVVKLEGMLYLCHTGMTQAIRNDLGSMYLGFYHQLLAQAVTLKATMQKRGWLRIPPLYQRGSGIIPQ